jgi:hypothetical protein
VCLDELEDANDEHEGVLVKLLRDLLTDYAGYLLIPTAGHADGDSFIFVLRWDPNCTDFVWTRIRAPNLLEPVAFADL